MTTLQRQQKRRRLLREGALASLTIGLLIWGFATLIPPAVDQRKAEEAAAARPSIDAMAARNAQAGPVEPEKPALEMLAKPGESPDWNLPDYDDPGPYFVTATAFSSHECQTTWCRQNAGKPAGHQVALNPSYGKRGTICSVIVYGLPSPDIHTAGGDGTTFEVIGYTDEQTQLDIWYGDDYAGAKAFGRQERKVDLVACPGT